MFALQKLEAGVLGRNFCFCHCVVHSRAGANCSGAGSHFSVADTSAVGNLVVVFLLHLNDSVSVISCVESSTRVNLLFFIAGRQIQITLHGDVTAIGW